MQTKSAILECVLCSSRFREADVRLLRYFPSTRVCASCYQRSQRAPYSTWCFGKPTVVGPNGRVLEYGYNEKARECREECTDREVCHYYLMKRFSHPEIECPLHQIETTSAHAWVVKTVYQAERSVQVNHG